jgi:cation diffusion facilitator CzcD-associated flavoprotein CzcO
MATRQPRIAILGAGFGGLCMAIRLRKAGIGSFTVYEKAAGLGGTWRDNTYPGLACDIPSFLYSYSFAPFTSWSRRYPEQPEILAYLHRCARRYGLEPHIRYNVEIASAVFDEGPGVWHLTSTDGEEIEAEIVVSGLGQLNRPRFPDIPGIGDFRGTSFHSARWKHDHDLSGRRVAVIGNGASAVQFIPRIAPLTDRLTVFQRSATWVLPKTDFAYGRRIRVLLGIPPVAKAYRATLYGRHELMFRMIRGGWAGRIAEKWAGRHRREQLAGHARLRADLTPDYPIGCKRLAISNDFYPALARDNVNLVTARISRVTPGGVLTVDGTEHLVDTIIYSTGFRANELMAPLEIVGRGGRRLSDDWKDGAHAYLGVTVPGYPNLFLLYGPNTNLGHNSVILMLEAQVGYVLQCVRGLRSRGLAWMDVRQDVMRAYDRRIDEALHRTVWEGSCTSWYKTESGKVVNNWPFSTLHYRRVLARPRFEHYTVAAAPTAG